jgi:hypothetical protein
MKAETSQFIPWPEIKVSYEELRSSGKSHNQASKELSTRFPVTRIGIRKRAEAEGWAKDVPAHSFKAIQAANNTQIAHDPTYPKANPERIASILGMVAMGAPEYLAAQQNGIDRTTLADWKTADPAFSKAVDAAKASRAIHRVGKIEEASDRGDWKASAFLLSRDPLTREDFGEQQSKGGIAIQINITRGDDVETVVSSQ